ncbi:hypothetical protein ACFWY5_12460 [Nonomuraea sp. NPDC059007]|uniref:hypothetical protein n=1 Tax=Nonomuraea sp. NPDC059007 TaxID=3346692 RepID=UPI00369F80BF
MAKPVKKCNCRDENGKKLGQKCPQLTRRAHGEWWVRYEAPAGPDGSRRRPWAGPYRTEGEAKTELIKLLADVDAGIVPDGKLRFGQWVDDWLAGKKNLKPSTYQSYAEAVKLYGKPGLGHIYLTKLNETHLGALYEAMGQINNLPPGEEPSEMLKRLLAARAPAPWKYGRDSKGKRLDTPHDRPWRTQPSRA